MPQRILGQGDQIRITRISNGWVAVLHSKDGKMIDVPTAKTTFATPQEAVAYLAETHDLK